MMIPTIHTNGTAKADLIKSIINANRALAVALVAMAECRPNGRDYYPQGPEAFGKARDEHAAIEKAVLDAQTSLMDRGLAIDEA